MIDSSSKTVSGAWTQILNFVISVVRGYNINPNCVRAAVIRYSNRAEAPIQLTSYGDVNSLVQAIGRIQLLGGGSNLATALDLLRSQVFASSVVRSNTVRIAVIVTDQLQSSSQITTAANNTKSQGITIVGVAITGPRRVDVNFFNSIVSNNWLIQVVDYSQLISGARNTIITQYGCFPDTPSPALRPSQYYSPAKAREYVFTGVGLCVCLCVCLSVTTITKKVVHGFVPNFTGRFLGG